MKKILLIIMMMATGCSYLQTRQVINPWTWQDQWGFVQGNKTQCVSETFYTAGIVATDANGNLLHASNMEMQVYQTLNNIETILSQADMQLSDVVRFTYYTTDINAFSQASQELINRLNKANCRPATSLIGVASLYHPDCMVEIEAIAVK